MRYSNFVKKYISFCIIALLGVVNANAQIEFTLKRHFDEKGSILETDVLGNIYLLDEDGIRKYNNQGNKEVEAGAIAYGDQAIIDATDPLELLIYYSDYNQLTILDNQLAEMGDPVNLDEMGIVAGHAICRSYDNGIWLFDQINFQLIRFDEQLSIRNQSGNLQQLLGFLPQPEYMVETARNLYLCDPDRGILVFDLFGSYYKTIPIKNVKKVEFRNNLMFYQIEQQLFAYDLILANQSEALMDLKGAIDFSIHEDQLILLRTDGVHIYSVKVQ